MGATSSALRLCLVGAAGRMGQRVAGLLRTTPDVLLVSVLEQPGRALGAGWAPSVRVTDDPAEAIALAEVVLDFSAPAAVRTVAPICVTNNVGLVVASTGLTAADQDVLQAAAAHIPVLQAANLSKGVNVLLHLVEQAARQLPGFEIEVLEVHHRHKKDAPSGTALALGRAARAGRPELMQVRAREGVGDARGPQELAYAALRGGDVAGEHTVYLFGDGERLELTHRATSPEIFAHGALAAVRFVAGRQPGRYTMQDVLAHKG